MLMTLGPIRFEVYPFNATEYDHGHETSFVEKPVLGARPPLEWVGEGAESWSIRAIIRSALAPCPGCFARRVISRWPT